MFNFRISETLISVDKFENTKDKKGFKLASI